MTILKKLGLLFAAVLAVLACGAILSLESVEVFELGLPVQQAILLRLAVRVLIGLTCLAILGLIIFKSVQRGSFSLQIRYRNPMIKGCLIFFMTAFLLGIPAFYAIDSINLIEDISTSPITKISTNWRMLTIHHSKALDSYELVVYDVPELADKHLPVARAKAGSIGCNNYTYSANCTMLISFTYLPHSLNVIEISNTSRSNAL